jgi:hypothetical protein
VIGLGYDYVAGYDAYATDQRVMQIVLNYVNNLSQDQTCRMGALAYLVEADPGVVTSSVTAYPATDYVPSATGTIRTDSAHVYLNTPVP